MHLLVSELRKCFLFVIYKGNETSVDCIKLGREIKKQLKIIGTPFNNFIIKNMCLRYPGV